MRNIESVNSYAYKEVHNFKVTKVDEKMNETEQVLSAVTYLVVKKREESSNEF